MRHSLSRIEDELIFKLPYSLHAIETIFDKENCSYPVVKMYPISLNSSMIM